jgi:hypothetical protein
MTLAKAKAKAKETVTVQASLTIIKIFCIVQAIGIDFVLMRCVL